MVGPLPQPPGQDRMPQQGAPTPPTSHHLLPASQRPPRHLVACGASHSKEVSSTELQAEEDVVLCALLPSTSLAREAAPHSWQAGPVSSCFAVHVDPICRGHRTGVGEIQRGGCGTGLKHFHLRMWREHPPTR